MTLSYFVNAKVNKPAGTCSIGQFLDGWLVRFRAADATAFRVSGMAHSTMTP